LTFYSYTYRREEGAMDPIKLQALMTISQGVYLTGARDTDGRLIGSCIDSAMLAEVDPPQLIVSLGKQSYTGQQVLKTGRLSLSVLPADTPDWIIQTFGAQSSRTEDKWDIVPHHIKDDLPVLDGAVAQITLSVARREETSAHHVLLCDVTNVYVGTMARPLLYADYQKDKVIIVNAEMKKEKKWVCTVCGYVYEGATPFEELPDDWVCPLCGEPKSVFVLE